MDLIQNQRFNNDSLDAFEWRKQRLPDYLLFTYDGKVTEGLFDWLLDQTEHHLGTGWGNSKSKRKSFSIAVEMLQNLLEHHNDPQTEIISNQNDFISYVLGATDDEFVMLTGNYLSERVVSKLNDQLSKLNVVSSKEIKKMYLEVLGNGEFSNIGGAGLGLITIARKSGDSLEYNFSDTDNGFTFFSLCVKVPFS